MSGKLVEGREFDQSRQAEFVGFLGLLRFVEFVELPVFVVLIEMPGQRFGGEDPARSVVARISSEPSCSR